VLPECYRTNVRTDVRNVCLVTVFCFSDVTDVISPGPPPLSLQNNVTPFQSMPQKNSTEAVMIWSVTIPPPSPKTIPVIFMNKKTVTNHSSELAPFTAVLHP
jgi:hypothetical protein